MRRRAARQLPIQYQLLYATEIVPLEGGAVVWWHLALLAARLRLLAALVLPGEQLLRPLRQRHCGGVPLRGAKPPLLSGAARPAQNSPDGTYQSALSRSCSGSAGIHTLLQDGGASRSDCAARQRLD